MDADRPVEVALLDAAGVIVSVNHAWRDFAVRNGGDPDSTGVGASYLAACEAADDDPWADEVAGSIRAALRGELPVAIKTEIPCHRPDRWRWFDVQISSRFGDDGRCLGATVTLSPALSSMPAVGVDDHSDGLLDLVPDAVVAVDPTTLRLVYANQAATELFGWSRAELIGMRVEDLHLDVDDAERRRRQDDLSAGRPGHTMIRQITVLDRDGVRIPCEVHVHAATGPDGAPRVINVLRDLRDLMTQARTAQASVEAFNTAFERAPTGMSMTGIDADGHRVVRRANQAFADLVGLPLDQVVGRDIGDLVIEDDDVDRCAAARIARGELTTHAHRERFRRRDGTSAWVELRTFQVHLPNLPGTTVLTQMVDVTDRELLEEQRARREALNVKLAQVTTQLLAGDLPEQTYQPLAEAAAALTLADSATVVLPHGPDGDPERVAVTGPIATGLQADRIPFSPAMVLAVTRTGQTQNWPRMPADTDPRLSARVGPLAGAPIALEEGQHGVLAVARGPDDPPFQELDLVLLTRLAAQAGLAIQLARARVDRERLAVLEDRQRIARDLHDTVIQDLIAVGMQLGFQADREPDPDRRERGNQLLEQVDGAVRRLRAAVFSLQEPPDGDTLAEIAAAIAADTARVLGHRPELLVRGSLDDLPDVVVDQAAVVLREALSNVARHARATSTRITITAGTGRFTLTVDDDGCGIPDDAPTGNGLRNLRHRATTLGGTARVSRREPGGTRLSWSCPIP
jgi:PAS domain S-box-containing protein